MSIHPLTRRLPVFLLGLIACAAHGQAPAPEKARPSGPTLEQVYGGKGPDFLDEKRLKSNQPLKLSRQPWFFNMADLEHDYRVDALLKKGDELLASTDYRGAIKLYQEVIANFPNDLWRIQADGIFIPSALYAQRQLLRMPSEQILYYRTLYDAEARPIFEKAKKYFSPLDLAEVAERYLATSYGPQALWELGNMALDQRDHAKALFYFRQIRDSCPIHNIPEAKLSLRLAACYKHLGMEKEYAEARREAAGDSELAATAGPFLKALDQVKLTPAPYFRQVRNPECVSLGDYDLFPDPTQPVGRTEFVWSESQPQPQREWYVRALPWISGNCICYLHHNVVYCRSLLTGKLNWSFGPGGSIDWFDRAISNYANGIHSCPVYHPESDLLIHDGLVFASIVKDGPSLVAVDQITGQLRWARGAISATSDTERATRYLSPPAPGANVVYAPYVLDEISGQSHLTTRTGIQCLDSRTGRLIWSRDDSLLTPPQFNISSRIRRIRVYGTQPTVRDGVVYHCTNAGVMAALDAVSGRVLWCTRYPHDEDVHDLLKDATQQHTLWYSRPPLLHEGRVYVTPVDSPRLLCLEASTGRVLWSLVRANEGIPHSHTLVGINAAGELVLAGYGLSGFDLRTGKKLWSRPAAPADTTARIPNANQNRCRPFMSRTNKIYFNANAWGGTHTEQYWDMGEKKTVAERWYYDTGHTRTLTSHNEQIILAAQKAIREPTPEELVSNTTELFTTYHRMTFERYGTLFELEVSPQAISLWYDRDRVLAAVSKDTSPQGLFRRAELLEMQGDRKTAVGLFEQALAGVPAFPTPFRTEINRQLFRLYNRQAESAVRAGDLAAAERFCEQMALACTTSDDEIHTILALAEIAEKKGNWNDATAGLTGAIKHHGAVKIGLPAVLAGDTAALRARGMAVLGNLEGKSPRNYYSKEFDLAVKVAEGTLDNYFSILSPLEPEMQVETGQFAGRWLQRLLAKAPEAFRRKYEASAEEVLRSETEEATILRLLGEYPNTAAAQKALDRLLEQTSKLPEPSRRIALWRLNDAGRTNGLQVPPAVQEACNIRVPETPPVPLVPSYRQAAISLDYDVNTLVLLLQPGDGSAAKENLAFLGLRSKRINANKFGLACWDLAANKKRWEVGDIRLKDKGEEEGFTKWFLHNGDVVVHGWYDVLAFAAADGKLRWRFQVPYGFRILDAALAEDVLVLTDNTRTIAVHLGNGQLIWEANETGGAYSPPYLRDNLLVTVRRNPAGVAFRDLGTGRLLTLLPLPGLSEATRNPAVSWDEPGVPLATTRDALLLTDGWDYIAVDLPSRRIRWQKRIANLDRGAAQSGTESAAFRFWVNETALVVLKPSYDSVGLEAIGLADGALRWQLNEAKMPGVLHNLVLTSDTVVGLYHPKEEASALQLLAYRLDDGKQLFKQVQRGFTKPQTWLPGPIRGDYLIVHVSDEQKRNLLVVEARSGKVIHQVEVKGFGQWGQYGQVSYSVQGAYLVVLSDKELTVASPGK
jgi:outer membrane protein assembly factor BamB